LGSIEPLLRPRFLRLLPLRFFFWVRFPAISSVASVGAYSIPCLAPSP